MPLPPAPTKRAALLSPDVLEAPVRSSSKSSRRGGSTRIGDTARDDASQDLALLDQLERIPVTGLYYGLAWFATLLAILLLLVGLWNATLTLSEKGFYGMAFLLSLFGAIAVQKNTRDMRSGSVGAAAIGDSE